MTPDPLTAAREALAEYNAQVERRTAAKVPPPLADHLRAALAEADRLRAILTPPTDAERARLLHVATEAADDPNPRPALAYRLANALPRLLAALAAAEGERDRMRRVCRVALAEFSPWDGMGEPPAPDVALDELRAALDAAKETTR